MADRALITGCAGFIGSALARALLAQGWHVTGVDNFDAFYARALKEENLRTLAESSRFSFHELDIRDRERVQELVSRSTPTVLYHLAALAGVRPSIADPARYVSVNLDGTTHLLDAAVRIDGLRFVFASSSSVYGNNRKTPFSETDPVNEPISPYAATKRAGELLAHTYSHLNDLPVACLRFFTVFGPAQRPDLAIMKFMRMIAAGESIPRFGDGSTSRDYTYIDDIVAGVLAAAERIGSPQVGRFRIWNLGNSTPVRLDEMIETIGQVVGRTPRIAPEPEQPGDVERTWADLSRSSSELGYRPTTSFRDGVERQWEWLQPRL